MELESRVTSLKICQMEVSEWVRREWEGGREGGRESERVTRGRGACECACGQVAVRVRVRVHMQESARTRTCCRRCVRVFVLCKCACLCGGKACGHVHARAEQRQVLIPHGVSRDTMRRVVVWASGRGWAEDARAVLGIFGAKIDSSENKNA